MSHNLEIGFLLDRQWRMMMGGMDESKKPALLALARVFDETATTYAIIGGVAMQVHAREPRTTVDIDVAVLDRATLPLEELAAAGFIESGRFTHSDNWIGPGGFPVQFTDDPEMHDAVVHADVIDLHGMLLRVASRLHLLKMKLRAATDATRRRSKKIIDLADALALIEDDSSLVAALSDEERRLIDILPT